MLTCEVCIIPLVRLPPNRIDRLDLIPSHRTEDPETRVRIPVQSPESRVKSTPSNIKSSLTLHVGDNPNTRDPEAEDRGQQAAHLCAAADNSTVWSRWAGWCSVSLARLLWLLCLWRTVQYLVQHPVQYSTGMA